MLCFAEALDIAIISDCRTVLHIAYSLGITSSEEYICCEGLQCGFTRKPLMRTSLKDKIKG